MSVSTNKCHCYIQRMDKAMLHKMHSISPLGYHHEKQRRVLDFFLLFFWEISSQPKSS